METARTQGPPIAMVAMLSGGQRQAVAICRAAAAGGRIVILDEPTAALGVRESAAVLRLIAALRDSGRAVIFISHNLQHVLPVADRVQVLHRGRSAGVLDRAEATPDLVVRLIMQGGQVDLRPAVEEG